LDNGNSVNLAELVNYEQIMFNDGPSELFYNMYESRGLKPEKIIMSNTSASAQSIVGRSDAVSLRILKPAHGLSPLGDEIVCPRVAEDVVGPCLVTAHHKSRSPANALKQEVFMESCRDLFSSGEMRQHINY
jgi:hypothetical protein